LAMTQHVLARDLFLVYKVPYLHHKIGTLHDQLILKLDGI
jgi:hypothetical protein